MVIVMSIRGWSSVGLFLMAATAAGRLENPVWLDTVNVPVGETVDVVIDFTNPVIKGMSLFHCHLLNHEDKGMMAKILLNEIAARP
jgi:FtsP/CotA-like multicopper oxidase with cupredoxin domain